jgi:hypothetical protein
VKNLTCSLLDMMPEPEPDPGLGSGPQCGVSRGESERSGVTRLIIPASSLAVRLLDFTDVNQGWLVLGNTTWHTADGGRTWTRGERPAGEIPGDTRRMSGSRHGPANRLEPCICRFPTAPTTWRLRTWPDRLRWIRPSSAGPA